MVKTSDFPKLSLVLEGNAGSRGAAGELIGSQRNPPSQFSLSLFHCLQNGNTALAIAKRLGYISVVDTLKVVTEEVTTTTTVSKRNWWALAPLCWVVSHTFTYKTCWAFSFELLLVNIL